jgi:hypothetical protein
MDPECGLLTWDFVVKAQEFYPQSSSPPQAYAGTELSCMVCRRATIKPQAGLKSEEERIRLQVSSRIAELATEGFSLRRSPKRMIIGVGTILMVIVLGSLFTGPSGSTWNAFTKVNDGLCEAEVVAILGPSGQSHYGPVDFCVGMTGDEFLAFEELTTREWVTDEALIWVGFGPDGRVVRKFCTANRRGPSSWFEVACYRLGS